MYNSTRTKATQAQQVPQEHEPTIRLRQARRTPRARHHQQSDLHVLYTANQLMSTAFPFRTVRRLHQQGLQPQRERIRTKDTAYKHHGTMHGVHKRALQAPIWTKPQARILKECHRQGTKGPQGPTRRYRPTRLTMQAKDSQQGGPAHNTDQDRAGHVPNHVKIRYTTPTRQQYIRRRHARHALQPQLQYKERTHRQLKQF